MSVWLSNSSGFALCLLICGSWPGWHPNTLVVPSHPFIAIHTTRRAVADAEVGEEAVNVVKKKMYVDDYLGSARNVKEGLKEASVVRKALADADLHFKVRSRIPKNLFE